MKVYKHKSGLIKEVKDGDWSWLAFLLGPLYFWYKGLVWEGIVLFIANIVASIVFMPFLAWIFGGLWFNTAYEEKLIKEGFKLVK